MLCPPLPLILKHLISSVVSLAHLVSSSVVLPAELVTLVLVSWKHFKKIELNDTWRQLNEVASPSMENGDMNMAT